VRENSENCRRPNLRLEPDEFVFDVLHLFFNTTWTITKIAERLKHKWSKPWFTREQVYPVVREAIRRRFLLLRPPLNLTLGQRVLDLYGLCEGADRSVHVCGPAGDDLLADAAAQAILCQVPEQKNLQRKSVSIGLGGGRCGKATVKKLAALLRARQVCPDFVVVPLASALEDAVRSAALAGYLDLDVNEVAVAWPWFHGMQLDVAVVEVPSSGEEISSEVCDLLERSMPVFLLAGPNADVEATARCLDTPFFNRFIVAQSIAQKLVVYKTGGFAVPKKLEVP